MASTGTSLGERLPSATKPVLPDTVFKPDEFVARFGHPCAAVLPGPHLGWRLLAGNRVDSTS